MSDQKIEKMEASQAGDMLTALLSRVRAAQAEYATFSQGKVDEIFKAAATAANGARIPLAEMAVKETGMGVFEDKVLKNHYAAEYIYNRYKDEKTCGVVERDEANGYTRVAEPIGVAAAVIPTTNPTSTAIFKALICLKTRNGLIMSPHPRAKKCTIEAAKIVLQAAVEEVGYKEILAGICHRPLDGGIKGLCPRPDKGRAVGQGNRADKRLGVRGLDGGKGSFIARRKHVRRDPAAEVVDPHKHDDKIGHLAIAIR